MASHICFFLPLLILNPCMKSYYFCRASRLLTGHAFLSGGRNARPSVLPLLSGNHGPRLGFQTGRAYSQTNAPKPSPKSTKAKTREIDGAPVTPPGAAPETRPRDSRDHSTRIFSPGHEQSAPQSSTSSAFNPPGGGGNLPGGSGSGSLFPITSSPLMDAALTTIIGLGMGE